jgi:hypothetical protein
LKILLIAFLKRCGYFSYKSPFEEGGFRGIFEFRKFDMLLSIHVLPLLKSPLPPLFQRGGRK